MAQLWNAWAKNWGTSWGSSWGPLEIAPNGERSGYWRMMFAQLQEEALKPPASEQVEKKVVFKLVDSFAPKMRKRKSRTVEKSTPAPKVRERLIYNKPQPVSFEAPFVLNLTTISREFYWWAQTLPKANVISIHSRKQRNRRRAAALLLMAA